jgi:maleylacetate reductase
MHDIVRFTHDGHAHRVRMGEDILENLGEEITRLGCERALVVTTPGREKQARALVDALGDHFAGLFADSKEQVPRETVDAARQALLESGADCCITVGGGSATGVGKALALEAKKPLPLLAVPTTYSGSEATAIWGISSEGRKTTGRDMKVAPATILYIPSWTAKLPMSISAASGVNAMAHCVEALYAIDATPMTTLMSIESIRALRESLAKLETDLGDLEARAEAFWGAYLAGRALDAASLGLHHKLCHVLGGSFGLPHATTHAIVLPYATAYNEPAAPGAMREIARAMGDAEGRAATLLFEQDRRLGIPESLGALGFSADDIPQVIDEVLQKKYPNPRTIERAPLQRMLEDATAGNSPGHY